MRDESVHSLCPASPALATRSRRSREGNVQAAVITLSACDRDLSAMWEEKGRSEKLELRKAWVPGLSCRFGIEIRIQDVSLRSKSDFSVGKSTHYD